MLNERKNGEGVEIDFNRDETFIGKFEKGKKNGDFIVLKPN